ncbi:MULTISPECIES: glycogen/starch/alpha-glucan phosphorylase [Terrabacteria group]|uniref:glycogen/starch/alpha-glucan phosphorylase n=1 Tax=Bacillati TaxID=1783272 RepID=UPI001C6E0337|nr:MULTISPECIES: glycogen/starch/alpha-glucan phosphorylase [Terrabacteria group]MBW9213079.1 glycogen/starch/alpha-glucan family phosphorylase [Trueperella sp. zg.1013]
MELEIHLNSLLPTSIQEASDTELFQAIAGLVQQKKKELSTIQDGKKLYYISAEFLIGKQLGKNLINLGLYDELNQLLSKYNKNLKQIEQIEKEPSLGNGGLGRLAACFLDSIATLNLQGDGVGLNYHLGLFRQEFKNRKQVEVPDEWQKNNTILNPTNVHFSIELAGKTYTSTMYDIDIIGYHGQKNQLHLFDLDTIDESIVHDGIEFDKTDISKNLTLFLYPDDRYREGQLLRIYQQYFMVSNAAQLIIQEEKSKGHHLKDLDKHVSVQINDTHPSMIIPELIRLLTQEGIDFEEAVTIVSNSCAYTNHTILAEALEKWSLDYLQEVVPQLVPIIHRLHQSVQVRFQNNPELAIIDEYNRVHMARIDMHYSASINGVAALHTEILKNQELKAFYSIYPHKFNNKTNGITFRRWIMHCNPELVRFIDDLIGDTWHKDAQQLERLLPFIHDEKVLQQLEDIKYHNKVSLAQFVKENEGIDVDPSSIFDVQVKRLHEYKRQQLNALWVIHQYLQIKAGHIPSRPITVIFGAKAAPAYDMAKNIIHLLLCLQDLIRHDSEVCPHLKVVVLTNYNIAKSEIVVPACDISEQISLASKEASGTGNMKFMLNGAITLGTNDGANVEIGELVGGNHIYTFGKSSDEVIQLYETSAYHAIDYYQNNEMIRQCVNFITSKELLDLGDEEMLSSLKNNLIHHDWFMTLLDVESYFTVKTDLLACYENRMEWLKKSLINIAKAGFFSSDRTIAEYNHDIWHLK